MNDIAYLFASILEVWAKTCQRKSPPTPWFSMSYFFQNDSCLTYQLRAKWRLHSRLIYSPICRKIVDCPVPRQVEKYFDGRKKTKKSHTKPSSIFQVFIRKAKRRIFSYIIKGKKWKLQSQKKFDLRRKFRKWCHEKWAEISVLWFNYKDQRLANYVKMCYFIWKLLQSYKTKLLFSE